MINGLALCAGAGGLELGVGLALGFDAYRTVCYVERETHVAAALVSRMAEGIFCPAAVWSDLATFDGRPWRGVVHLLTAGFPCQPFSRVGDQRGLDDDRWLWPDIARIIRDVGPQLLFLENVPPITVRGLGDILGSLADLRFAAEWDVFPASAIGAPHDRDRFYLLAMGDTDRDGFRAGRRGGHDSARQARRQSVLAGPQVDDPFGPRLQGFTGYEFRGDEPGWESPHPEARSTGATGLSVVSADDYDRPLFPPDPDDTAGWEGVVALWPDLAPTLEPPIRRVAHGSASRMERLRTCGNGVVPLAAAYAFCALAARLTERSNPR